MNPIAKEMNKVLQNESSIFYSMLSDFGKNIYMPKGIISQSGEAKQYAKKYNATIGTALENGQPMHFKTLMKYFNDIEPSEIFLYAPPTGAPDLRKKWKEKIVSENAAVSDDDISLPVVTHALTNGLFLIGDLFINPGDTIICPDKLWGNYRLIFEVRKNAKIETFKCFNEELTGFNVDGLDEAIKNSPNEKVILVLNFPNNPSGYTPTLEEADKIVEVVKKHADSGKKIMVVTDDAYYGLLFEDNLIPGSIFDKFAGIHDNIAAVKIDGFTKEHYVWGFRVGFITFSDTGKSKAAYEVLEKKVGACIRSSLSNCSKPAQSLLLKLIQSDDFIKEKEEKYNILKARALKVKEVVYRDEYADCWDVYPFNSGYFMCLRLKGVSSNDVRLQALHQYGVGTISIGETDLRIAFSCTEVDQIEDIFKIIAKSVREVKAKQ